LFGLAALHPQHEELLEIDLEDRFRAIQLKPYWTELQPLYMGALHALVLTPGDLPPLAHLNAILDALDPVLVPNVGGLALPEWYPADVVDGLVHRLAEALRPVFTASEPPLPLGVSLDDDMEVLLHARVLSEAALMEDLFWPPGQKGRVQLPKGLRPAPGRRHGFGDPEGDAAREAYMREVVPWYLAVRRVQAFACVMAAYACEDSRVA
ncbi:hypothetical protein Agub_g5696, partial [Astrephomene gubernaculifera]